MKMGRIGVAIGVAAVLALWLAKLLVSQGINVAFIARYERGQTGADGLGLNLLWNWPEPYVAENNAGLAAYAKGEMAEAARHYEQALVTVPEGRRCDVRTNWGLAQFGLVELTAANAAAELRVILTGLTAEGCATASGKGTDEHTQALYDEIAALLQESEESGDDGSSDDGENSEDSESEEGDEAETEQEQVLQQQLQEKAIDASNERNNGYYNSDFRNGYEYYDGKAW